MKTEEEIKEMRRKCIDTIKCIRIDFASCSKDSHPAYVRLIRDDMIKHREAVRIYNLILGEKEG